ncbi:MAG TPA: MFS transporter [Trebonia sp.]|jgi:hypothetical protein|nr:MFS transporter [Trebonia sp.]
MARLALPRALTPLRHGSFRLLTAGQVTSNVGDACYAVALPWYVLAAHGGTVLLGTVLAAYGVPRTALILVGGWASDRWRPQTVMMATDIARALAMAGLAAAAALGPARAVILIPIAVILGSGEGLFLPASFSIIPSLLPADDLQSGNALASGGTQAAALAGPAIGGALVAFGGTSLAFALDAASFAVSAATLAVLAGLTLRGRPAGPGEVTARAGATAAADTEPGAEPAPSLARLMRSERILQIVMLVDIAANLGSGGMSEVSLPALAHGPLHSGATGYGAILAAFSAGALLGTVAAGQAHRVGRPVIAASVAFLVEAVAMCVAPYLGGTVAVAVAFALLGAMNGFGNVLTITAFQKWVPAGIIGKVTGLLMLGSFGVFPVSVALAAFSTRTLGPAAFFVFAGATLTVAILAGLTQREWRDFGRNQADAEETPLPEGAAI